MSCLRKERKRTRNENEIQWILHEFEGKVSNNIEWLQSPFFSLDDFEVPIGIVKGLSWRMDLEVKGNEIQSQWRMGLMSQGDEKRSRLNRKEKIVVLWRERENGEKVSGKEYRQGKPLPWPIPLITKPA